MQTEHKGAARPAVLTAGLGGSTSDKTIYCDNLTGWPTGSGGPFYAVLNKTKSNEEKVLCVSRSGNILTVFDDGLTVGRAVDDTAITSHSINETIEHIWTATEATLAINHVYATTGVHGRTSALVAVDDTQTLKNKSMSGAENTFSAIPYSALTGVPAADIVVVNKTASFTPLLSEDNALFACSHASVAIVCTLPSDASVAIPVGGSISIVRTGAAAVSFAAGGGATASTATSLVCRATNSLATAIKIAANTWLVTGDLA